MYIYIYYIYIYTWTSKSKLSNFFGCACLGPPPPSYLALRNGRQDAVAVAAAAVALWQIAAAVPCSCGGCGTCSLALKGFGNKENKNTIHNAFKLAYDAACIAGMGGQGQFGQINRHSILTCQVSPLLGEDAYNLY